MKSRIRKVMENVGFSYIGKGKMIHQPKDNLMSNHPKVLGTYGIYSLNLSWSLLCTIALAAGIPSIDLNKGKMTVTFSQLENKILG